MRMTVRMAAAGLAFSLAVVPAIAKERSAALDKIKETGVVTLGYRDGFIPLSYPGSDQKPVGFAIDLCSLATAKIREDVGREDLKVEYKPVDSQALPALLDDGSVDIACAALADTPELRQQVSLTVPVYASELRWLAPRRLRVEIESDWRHYVQIKTPTSAEDLRGQTVALTKRPGALSIALTLSNEHTLGLSILEAKDQAEGFRLVEQGKAAAFLGDALQLTALRAAARNTDAFTFLDEAYPGGDYGFAVRKSDPGLKALVDGVLVEAMRSGEYAKLYKKWFESPIPPKNLNLAFPMGERLRQLLSQAGARIDNQASN